MSLQQWENYYRSGRLATGPAGPDGLYDQEIRGAWEEFFALLPAEGRLLDIGTGNGVVPLIALQTAQRHGVRWRIDATDFALIDPPRDVPDGRARFAGVRFHPGVRSERLPFDAHTFDAVSGHYALEYGDITASLAEVARVLKAGGNAQFVLHHADSLLVRSARSALLDCDLVFKQSRLHRKLRRLLTAESGDATTLRHASDELVAAIRGLRAALGERRARGESGQVLEVALDAARSLLGLRSQMRPDRLGLEIDRAEEDLRTSARRLNDLVEHALDDEALAAVLAEAVGLGFKVAHAGPLLHDRDHLVGWQVRLKRS